jgi:hypothetical protein
MTSARIDLILRVSPRARCDVRRNLADASRLWQRPWRAGAPTRPSLGPPFGGLDGSDRPDGSGYSSNTVTITGGIRGFPRSSTAPGIGPVPNVPMGLFHSFVRPDLTRFSDPILAARSRPLPIRP